MSQTEWSADLEKSSDDSLLNFLSEYYNLQPQAVRAVIAEADRRGLMLPEQTRKEAELYANDTRSIPPQGSTGFFTQYDPNATTDPNAVPLYSQNAIYWFTVLMNAMYGAVLLVINIRKLGRSKGIFEVLAFGFGYSLAVMWIVSRMEGSTSMVMIPLNVLAGHLLRTYFWKKYIFEETVYRKRAVLPPVAIAVLISVALYLMIIYAA